MICVDLSRGMLSMIDDADADLIAYKWSVTRNGHDNLYACRSLRRKDRVPRKTILLHRVVLGRKLGRPINSWDLVDHINGDSLDNRRENLRLANHLANMANSKKIARRKDKPSTSKFKGVRLRVDTGKWEAYITHDRKRINLGCYITELEAARTYDDAARALFGEFANVNSSEWRDDQMEIDLETSEAAAVEEMKAGSA